MTARRSHSVLLRSRALLLDIDGVLTTTSTPDMSLDRELLRRFRSLIDRCPPLSVVLSSDWRLVPELLTLVRREIDICDITPDLPGRSRGEEVALWLNRHPVIQTFVILDDRDDFTPEQLPQLVRTTLNRGLTPELADRVATLFA